MSFLKLKKTLSAVGGFLSGAVNGLLGAGGGMPGGGRRRGPVAGPEPGAAAGRDGDDHDAAGKPGPHGGGRDSNGGIHSRSSAGDGGGGAHGAAGAEGGL